MKARIVLLIGTAGVSCMLLASCGGSNHGAAPVQTPVQMPPNPPPPPTTKDLDTAAVLAIVQTQTSETADPFEVDNAAVAVTPQGDETSAPINVDVP
jgi:hypothetical protein